MMADLAPLMSSEYDEWETPADLFNQLDSEFNFDLDAAASLHSTKCSRYIDKELDALKIDWNGRVFLNPPYGSSVGPFLEKAYTECKKGNVELIVCLVPARTDTRYWHDFAMKAAEIRFIKGRVKFGARLAGTALTFTSAPFPSALVIFYKGVWQDNPVVSSYQILKQDKPVTNLDLEEYE